MIIEQLTNINSEKLYKPANPLISVIVITYNSSNYVLETLESANAQTYQNIELIVSDDCSTDNTVDICRNWIDENKDRFVRIELLSVEINTGIPANCNRGVKAAHGEWIKLISGDDALYSNAIENGVDYIKNNLSVKIFASSFSYFDQKLDNSHLIRDRNDFDKPFFNSPPEKQYSMLLRDNYIHSPTVFILKQLLYEVDMFDERFKYVDDHPLYIKISKHGVKFEYMNKLTVKYRLHDSSVFASKQKGLIFNNFYKNKRQFELEYIFPNIKFRERFARNCEYYRKSTFDYLGLNNDTMFNKLLFQFTYAISPQNILNCLSKLKSQILKINDRSLNPN